MRLAESNFRCIKMLKAGYVYLKYMAAKFFSFNIQLLIGLNVIRFFHKPFSCLIITYLKFLTLHFRFFVSIFLNCFKINLITFLACQHEFQAIYISKCC